MAYVSAYEPCLIVAYVSAYEPCLIVAYVSAYELMPDSGLCQCL